MNSLSIGTILGLMHGSFIISFYSPLNHVIRASHSKVVGIRVLVPTGLIGAGTRADVGSYWGAWSTLNRKHL